MVRLIWLAAAAACPSWGWPVKGGAGSTALIRSGAYSRPATPAAPRTGRYRISPSGSGSSKAVFRSVTRPVELIWPLLTARTMACRRTASVYMSYPSTLRLLALVGARYTTGAERGRPLLG